MKVNHDTNLLETLFKIGQDWEVRRLLNATLDDGFHTLCTPYTPVRPLPIVVGETGTQVNREIRYRTTERQAVPSHRKLE